MKFTVLKAGLMLGVAASGITVAAPAIAQADAAFAGEAIVVTARRVEENLQDVPISITVFDQEQLTDRNIAVASDLATYTPSLTVNERYGPEKASFAIRGFNQDHSTAPTVGVYFADVVGVRALGGTTSGNTVGAGAFTDLQNVQVLKGPQGTLFGRNTTGGAVLLVPQKPTDYLEGYVEGSMGNYDMRRVQAAVNLPLADTFKIRLSADRMKRDGYMKNRSGVGPDDYNDTDYFYGRFSMVAELTPDLENYTIAHYSKSDTNGYASRMQICNEDIANPGTIGQPGFNATAFITANAGCDQIARQAALGHGPLDVSIGIPDAFLELETWQVINTTTWLASDNLTVKNIASYGEFREYASFSLNGDNFFVPEEAALLGMNTVGQPFDNIYLDVFPGQPNAGQWSFTEELQFQYASADGRFNGVLGGYLEFARPIGWSSGRTAIYADCADPETLQCQVPLGFGIISQSRTNVNFDNHGIFGQGTFAFTDQLALTLGGRWTFDKIDGVSEGTRLTLAEVPGVGVIPVSQVCNDNLRNPGVDIVLDGTGDLSQCRTELTAKSNEPTWLVNLDYKPTQDILLYAKWARGYRQGGLNFTNVGLEAWEPEKLDSFEIGAKTNFGSGSFRGYFNAAAFYNDFSGQQIFGQLIPSPTSTLAGAAGILNAGSSELYGLEIDAAVTLFDDLRLQIGYTYLETEIKELTVPSLEGTEFINFIPDVNVGDPLTRSPKHNLIASATYALPLDESVGNVSFGATFVYTDKQAIGAGPLGTLPSYELLSLHANWDGVFGSPFDLSAFATNVTNEIYPIGSTQGYFSSGFENLLYGQPRMYGVRLRFNFGE